MDKERDSTALVMGIIACAIALYFQFQYTQLQARSIECEKQFESFKEGVIYGK